MIPPYSEYSNPRRRYIIDCDNGPLHKTVDDEQSCYEFLDFRSGVVEVSVILVCGTPLLGGWCQTFRDNLTVLFLTIEITF